MKKRIIEFLIKHWLPKYRLVKIRGPYRKRVEVVHMGRMHESPPPEFTEGGKNES